MRTSILSSLAAAALCAAAVPAAAQERAVAEYRFNGTHDRDLPSRVIVADSAGSLVAKFRLAGQSATQAMMIETLETDIVLQAETPSGVLTLVLYRQNGQVESREGVVGTWALGDRGGKLRGRSVR
jgi:hypothetical protein